VLLINPVAVPPVTHTDALFAGQSQSFLDNAMAFVRLDFEHRIARPRT
jgi:hypothetical protein